MPLLFFSLFWSFELNWDRSKLSSGSGKDATVFSHLIFIPLTASLTLILATVNNCMCLYIEALRFYFILSTQFPLILPSLPVDGSGNVTIISTIICNYKQDVKIPVVCIYMYFWYFILTYL